ncbi:unnamed protein product [Leuciscus chuanchicus]
MFDSIKLGKLCKTHISPSVQAVPRPVCMMKFASHRRCYMWKSEAAPLPLPGLPTNCLHQPGCSPWEPSMNPPTPLLPPLPLRKNLCTSLPSAHAGLQLDPHTGHSSAFFVPL